MYMIVNLKDPQLSHINDEISDDEYKQCRNNEINIFRFPYSDDIRWLEYSDNFYPIDSPYEQSFVQIMPESYASIPMG